MILEINLFRNGDSISASLAQFLLKLLVEVGGGERSHKLHPLQEITKKILASLWYTKSNFS
jgi:hypothetical protein